MNKWLWTALSSIVVLLVMGVVALFFSIRPRARELVHHPLDAEGRRLTETPADYGMPYEDVSVTTTDGLTLVGWYVPSENGAVIIAQHGYKGGRNNMLYDAQILHLHGYSVLLSTVRAHDQSDGDLITFGKEEMKDLEAWYQYLLARDDIDPERIGILGESMGAMVGIQYAAHNKEIKAVISHSGSASLRGAIVNTVRRFTGLPAFPLAPMVTFWAERELGFGAAEVEMTKYIGQISPRAVFILDGGKDGCVSTNSGVCLYEAAGEPKELWFEPEAGHHGLPEVAPEEYEQRVVAFFDQYLLGK